MPGKGRPKKSNPIPARNNPSSIRAVSTSSVSKRNTPKNVLYFIERTINGISQKDIDSVEASLKGKSGELLYLVLHTYGGDIYSAVKIMRILQYKFKEIRVIIPDFVYSSGTIMALGTDVIYLDVDACIGPLDKPMENPRDGSDISSLDITNTLTNLASTIDSIAGKFYETLRKEGKIKLSKIEAAKLAYETASNTVNPIINKIDPYFLQSGYRQTQIGLNYAIDMLISRMMKAEIRKAVKTAFSLVNDYPAHSYGIYREEARASLGLKVENLESLREWSQFEPKFKLLKRTPNSIEFMIF